MSNFEKFLETLQGVLIGLLGASVLYFVLHIVAYLTNRPQILGLWKINLKKYWQPYKGLYNT